MTRRRGLILPVVLVLTGLLALILASFLFHVRAEVAGAQAQRDAQQARLAAESALEEVTYILRQAKGDSSQWFDVPDRFRHALVWSEAFDRDGDPVKKMGSRKEVLEAGGAPEAWRYSVVAQNLDGLPDTMRYGVTPEASKLNLNTADEAELERLLLKLLMDLGVENAPELLATLLDWLDEDSETRPGGAEDDYYATLDSPYHAKNGPLTTLEELLFVKGWNAALLYGEDTNRNGILDPNENDGSTSPPVYDNGDGILQRGIAPYVTVWTTEPGADGQTKTARVDLNTAPTIVLAALEGMTAEAADTIVALRKTLEPQALLSPDWPVTSGALDPATYQAIQEKVTVQPTVFHVEVVAYGDHTKLARRYEWIVALRGGLPQVLYHRDLTRLGLAWPVDNDELLLRGR